MKQLIQFFIKEFNNIRLKIATKFDKSGGKITGNTEIEGELRTHGNGLLLGATNFIGVGSATVASVDEGVIRFISNGPARNDGAFIQYMPPKAGNTGANSSNILTISSRSNTDLDILNLKAKTLVTSGGIKLPVSKNWSAATNLEFYGIDMNNSDLIGANAIVFGDSTHNSNGEGILFPGPSSVSGVPETYDKVDAYNGQLRINGKEIIQGNRLQRSYFRAVTTIASTTSGGLYTFPFNAISRDNLGEFTTSTRRFYPKEAGLYQFNVTAKFKTVPQGTNIVMHIRAYTSAATERQFSTVYDNKNYYYGDFTASGSCMIRLEDGDYVVVQYYSTENWAGQISTSNAETYFEGVRLA